MQFRLARLLASAAVTALVALSLGGCQTTMSDITGSLGPKAEAAPVSDPQRTIDVVELIGGDDLAEAIVDFRSRVRTFGNVPAPANRPAELATQGAAP